MTEPLRLGIAGLGTVGVGIVRIVQKHRELLEARAGRPIVISAVSARCKTKTVTSIYPIMLGKMIRYHWPSAMT